MVMGPSTGLILGDLGADVIKIEPIGGDKTRYLRGSGAGYFAMFNRNKKSLSLNLKSEEGQAIVRKLLERADVATENFRPGALDKLGFGYEDVAKLNPEIIYQSSKGFLSGPYENRTALDEVAQMMGGLAYMTGPEGRPLRAGASVIDITGGMFGVIGILAALLDRDRNGSGGRRITSSLFETTVFLVGQHMAQAAVTGTPARPMPTRVSAWAIYDVFDCNDGKVFVGVVSDSQWQIFCDAFDFSEWKTDPSLIKNTDRVGRRPEFLPTVRERFAEMTTDELSETLARAGLPYAPINRPEDLPDDPHVSAGGLFELALPDQDATVSLPKLPLAVDGLRDETAEDPPAPGQHSVQILSDLGYDSATIQRLASDGIVA